MLEDLNKISIRIFIMQILALIITCSVGMWMTSNEMYIEQLYIVPFYVILMVVIIKLNNKWCANIIKFHKNK